MALNVFIPIADDFITVDTKSPAHSERQGLYLRGEPGTLKVLAELIDSAVDDAEKGRLNVTDETTTPMPEDDESNKVEEAPAEEPVAGEEPAEGDEESA